MVTYYGFIDKEKDRDRSDRMTNIGRESFSVDHYWNIDVAKEYGNLGTDAYVVQRKICTAKREINGSKFGYCVITEIINMNGQGHYVEEEFHHCQAGNSQTYDVWVRKGYATVPSLGKFADSAASFSFGSWVAK